MMEGRLRREGGYKQAYWKVRGNYSLLCQLTLSFSTYSHHPSCLLTVDGTLLKSRNTGLLSL